MLHSYQAELNGSQLIWIDPPPAPAARRRVVVVVEEAAGAGATAAPDAVQAFARARGCMGRASREQVLAGLAAMREDWSRNPLGDGQAQR
jgi:hypothetical protein